MTIGVLYEKVKTLDIEKVSVTALDETKEQRIEENRRQMQDGMRADGSEILPSYSDYTIAIKNSKNQESRFVTLKDTGAFQSSIISTIKGNAIETTSTDSKTEKLQKKYETSGGKLFGLSADNKAVYIDESLRPAFNKEIENATGLKLK